MRKSFLALMLASATIIAATTTPAMAVRDRNDNQENVGMPQGATTIKEAQPSAPPQREVAPRFQRAEQVFRAEERIATPDRGDGDRRGREANARQPQQTAPIFQPQPDRQARGNDGGGRDFGGRDFGDRNGQARDGGNWDRNRGSGSVFVDVNRDRARGNQGGGYDVNRNGDGYRHDDRRYDGGRRGDSYDNQREQRFGHEQRYGYDNSYGRDRQSAWNRDWRRDNRYNWQSYRNTYQSFYRAPRYYNPYGYSNRYQRFGIGVYLDSGFYGRGFWINDPYEYRLPSAPFGYRWVRYYDDVLLVDIRSGYVVDVIYSFFW